MRISCCVLVAILGCRGSNASGPDSPSKIDASKIDAPSSGDGGGSGECAGSYLDSTIADMRMGTKSGCFALTAVITLGTTPSSKSPEVYVQDAGGGDFSAMKVKCSSTSTTHPCAVATQVAALADGHSVTVQGTYIKTASTTFEEFFIDTVVDNGPGTAPAPAIATLADIERGSTATNLRFQHVTVTIGASDTLQMYDWTPTEFANAAATKCPFQFGFGMIPKSATGTTATAACTSGTAQPSGQTTPSSSEVLIGTDFFDGFTVSSDCRCAKTFKDTEPSTTSTLGGTIGGLLVFDVPFGSTAGYYFLDPKSATDAPITATVAGM